MLDHPIADVAESTRTLSEVRVNARAKVVAAIRSIERKLVEALAGERLRGTPRFTTRDAKSPFWGVRIGTRRRSGQLDGVREVLVLTDRGRLVAAKQRADGGVDHRLVYDDELIAEDLEPVMRSVREALERHVVASGKRAGELDRVATLADKITTALGED